MIELVGIPDAAKVLGVSRARTYKFIEDGRLRAEKVLGRLGVKPSELERFKAAKRVNGRPRSKEVKP